MEMNRLEKEVMRMLLAGDHEFLGILRNQLSVASISSREYSGAGFFLEFEVPRSAPSLDRKKSIWFGDVNLDTPDLKNGGGFVLFIDDGRLAMLEGYTYDEVWPDNLRDFRLTYEKEPRDFETLFKFRE